MAPSLLTVQRITPALVTPASPTPYKFKPLSDIDDQENLRFQAPFIQYYKNNPSMKGRDLVEIIKEALAKALVFYYPLVGRIREEEGMKLVVECNKEGALFIKADTNIRLEQLGEWQPPPLPWLSEFCMML